MKPNYVNIACGTKFIEDYNWINLDYSSTSRFVKKTNLLKGLPLKQESVDLAYSSHYLEHIPYNKVNDFLIEIFRILKPGGVLRLVLPDFEVLATSYINLRKKGEHEKANFLIMLIIDQCTRNINGGELGRYLQKFQGKDKSDQHMYEFIKEYTGSNAPHHYSHNKSKYDLIIEKFIHILNGISSRIQRYWIKAVLLALPPGFRSQNVALTDIGERHQWVWDFNSLKILLEKTGFVNIDKFSANTSNIKDFPFFPLDVDNKGFQNRGLQSMYIEAVKPKK